MLRVCQRSDIHVQLSALFRLVAVGVDDSEWHGVDEPNLEPRLGLFSSCLGK